MERRIESGSEGKEEKRRKGKNREVECQIQKNVNLSELC